MEPLYFDNNATTAVDPRVLRAMLPTFEQFYGNPSSEHPYGWRARALVERARELVSRLIGAATHEIEFTSGATESIQHALLGLNPKHLVTSATEHHATLDACTELVRRGSEITILPVDREGRVTVEQVLRALRPDTSLVTLMHGNNEIGTLHPIGAIGAALRATRPDIWFHVDAAQTAGKHEIDVDKMSIDLLSLSAHKLHGPKGVGALYKRSSPGRRVLLAHPLHQGTANVPGIVGLGAACEIAHIEGPRETARMLSQRDLIIETLSRETGVYLNGPRTDRLANNISLTIENVEPDQLMLALRDIAYSSASACTGPSHSHVLQAIGQPIDNPFLATVRFGLSRLTTTEEVSVLLEKLLAGIRRTREISGGYDPSTNPLANPLRKPPGS